jgi:SulP family sulfate permease
MRAEYSFRTLERTAPAIYDGIIDAMIALLEAQRAGLLKRVHLMPNIVSGLVVGIVAMPLAMAFAIASGATPAQGLYTAIVAGL